jgi:hypothetical protein
MGRARQLGGGTGADNQAYASDWSFRGLGVFVDDIEGSTGEGTTSFETGMDGWTTPGALREARPTRTTSAVDHPPPAQNRYRRRVVASPSMRPNSSSVSEKPNTSKLAAIRSGVADLGITTTSWSMCQRTTT